MSLPDDRLARSWLALVLLSGTATLLALQGGRPAGLAVLAIAALKARIILARYLRLELAPAWLRGFTVSLGLFALLLAGLYGAA